MAGKAVGKVQHKQTQQQKAVWRHLPCVGEPALKVSHIRARFEEQFGEASPVLQGSLIRQAGVHPAHGRPLERRHQVAPGTGVTTASTTPALCFRQQGQMISNEMGAQLRFRCERQGTKVRRASLNCKSPGCSAEAVQAVCPAIEADDK